MAFTTNARPLTKSQLVLLLHVQANGVVLVGTFRPAIVARYGLLARSGLLTEQEQHGEFRRFSLSPCGEEMLKQTPEAVLMDAHVELLAAELDAAGGEDETAAAEIVCVAPPSSTGRLS